MEFQTIKPRDASVEPASSGNLRVTIVVGAAVAIVAVVALALL
jgi:hypothetical protein